MLCLAFTQIYSFNKKIPSETALFNENLKLEQVLLLAPTNPSNYLVY